jgi:hypothetical protein
MRFSLGLVAVALAACGSGDDGDFPTCVPGALTVIGTVDGAQHEVTFFPTSHAFSNIGPDAEFTASVAGSSGSVSLAWGASVLDGDSTAARGQIDLPASSLVAGNCDTAALSGRLLMNDEGGGFRFVLRDLHASPFCSGAAITGELRGCFSFPVR